MAHPPASQLDQIEQTPTPVSSAVIQQAELSPCVCANRKPDQRWAPGTKMRESVRKYLILRDGANCRFFKTCGRKGIQIAHKCNNKSCENYDHLAMECVPCNNREKGIFSRQGVKAGVRVSANVKGELVPVGRDRTASEAKHETAWPIWVQFCKDIFEKVHAADYESFVRMSAKIANVSTYTVEQRYIRREDTGEITPKLPEYKGALGFLHVFTAEKGKRRLVELAREIVEDDFKP